MDWDALGIAASDAAGSQPPFDVVSPDGGETRDVADPPSTESSYRPQSAEGKNPIRISEPAFVLCRAVRNLAPKFTRLPPATDTHCQRRATMPSWMSEEACNASPPEPALPEASAATQDEDHAGEPSVESVDFQPESSLSKPPLESRLAPDSPPRGSSVL